MPKVTVYIKNEDINNWKSLASKTNFIHDSLKDLPPLPKIPKPVNEVMHACKHGFPIGFCKYGCKK